MIKKQLLLQLKDNLESLVNKYRDSVWSEKDIEEMQSESATTSSYQEGFRNGCSEFIKLMDQFNESTKELDGTK